MQPLGGPLCVVHIERGVVSCPVDHNDPSLGKGRGVNSGRGRRLQSRGNPSVDDSPPHVPVEDFPIHHRVFDLSLRHPRVPRILLRWGQASWHFRAAFMALSPRAPRNPQALPLLPSPKWVALESVRAHQEGVGKLTSPFRTGAQGRWEPDAPNHRGAI